MPLAALPGQFAPDQQPKRPGQIANLADLLIAKAIATNIGQLLDDWPVNFNALLSSIQAQQGQSTSLRNSFGVLHRVLYQDLAGTGFDFIRVAFEEYVNLNWWGLVCRRHKGFNPKTLTAHPRLALKEAAKICDTSLAVINHLIDAGKIQVDEYVSASGRRTRSIHQSDLPELKKLAAGFLCMADACTFLGIPERRVHELILAGKITPLASPGETRSARWYLPKSALQSLMFSGSASTPADAIAISSVLRGGRLDDGEFIAIVNGLQNGELSAVGVVSCPIGRVAVSKKALDEFRLRWAIQHHRSLSIDQGRRLVGVEAASHLPTCKTWFAPNGRRS
ncbi:helix-turn-helix domain-containing protein [Paludibacterium denitrificans]|uniref:Helix-turn-helix domain-containing protein n=1 Tax=Paludibacterium denitrificans TaxID=2675226 RepID=A0A844G9M4_9NEIS|nr:helix-turn-helix domain-containing protein [Paludibacterium denitrificans]MTD33063.1 hypothetical protein [Paludibacterium denitrificans]